MRKGLLQAESKEIVLCLMSLTTTKGEHWMHRSSKKLIHAGRGSAFANEKAATTRQIRVRERLDRIQRILQPTIDAEQAEHSKLMSSVDKAKDKADGIALLCGSELGVAVREQPRSPNGARKTQRGS